MIIYKYINYLLTSDLLFHAKIVPPEIAGRLEVLVLNSLMVELKVD